MQPRTRSHALLFLALIASTASAQQQPTPLAGWDKSVPAQDGYRLYLLVDM